MADFQPFGFVEGDFATILAGNLPSGPAVWLFSFAIEAKLPIFRHRLTGALLPAALMGMGVGADAAELMRDEPYTGNVDPVIVAHLRRRFTYEGHVGLPAFKATLRTLLSRAARDVSVFIMLANTSVRHPDGRQIVARALADQNAAIREVAAEFTNVALVTPVDFMSDAEIETLKSPHHYDRMVYFRIFTHIMECVKGQGSALDPLGTSPQTPIIQA